MMIACVTSHGGQLNLAILSSVSAVSTGGGDGTSHRGQLNLACILSSVSAVSTGGAR